MKKLKQFRGPFTMKITQSYINLRGINIGTPHIKKGIVDIGLVNVMIANDEEFIATGSLSKTGLITGMSKLFTYMNLKIDTKIEYLINRTNDETFIVITKPVVKKLPVKKNDSIPVLQKQHCSNIHLEAFRPGNLQSWEPKTEKDIYMVLGVLLEYTDYVYCTGINKALLEQLKLSYSDTAIPDAILIYKPTDEYLIAEFKILSSDFKKNHSADSVDILVCWHDDEMDRQVLPAHVLCIKKIAKLKAMVELKEC